MLIEWKICYQNYQITENISQISQIFQIISRHPGASKIRNIHRCCLYSRLVTMEVTLALNSSYQLSGFSCHG